MAETASVADFVAALRRCDLLEAPGWESLAGSAADATALARELIRAGALTPFQARMLLRGRGDEIVVGSFLLLDRIGSGGMGQVFKAHHRLMGRVVALKLIRPELLAQPTLVARFQQEVQAAARLDHPNIVRALHAERTARGFFLAMEFCEGRDLAKVISEAGGPLPVHLACDYAAQAAAGLSAAHAAGLVHRDIKPGNLFLTTGGVVKVLDFGLARLHTTDDKERLTRTGSVMGTPNFIAPEQVRDSSTADARCDLYSLGCTLYYLLAGQVPYPGGTDWEKILKHFSGTPAAIDAVRPEVPAGVAAVVRKVMAREPAARYQSAAEVVAALAPYRTPALAVAAESVAPVTGFAPPFVGSRSDSTAPHVPATTHPVSPSSATPAPTEPVDVPEVLRLTDEAPALDPETLDGARSVTAPDRRPARRESYGLWVGVGVAAFLAVLAGVVIAITAGDNRSRVEQERNPPPGEPQPKSKTGGVGTKPGGEVGRANDVLKPPVFKMLDSRDDDLGYRHSEAFRLAYAPRLEAGSNPRVLAVAIGSGSGSGNQPGGAEIWDLTTLTQKVVTVTDARPATFTLAFSADGRFLASGAGSLDFHHKDAPVAVFDTRTWKRLASFPTNSDGVFSLAFNPDSRYLVVGTKPRQNGGGGGLEVWDGGADWTGTPARLDDSGAYAECVNGIAFAPGAAGMFFTAGGTQTDGSVRSWKLSPDGKLQRSMILPNTDAAGPVPGPYLGLALSRDGRWLATGTCSAPGDPPGVTRRLALWDCSKTGGAPALTSVPATNDSDFLAFEFLPDNSGLVTTDKKGHIQVWDVPGLAERKFGLKPHEKGRPWGIAFSPDDREVAVIGQAADWVPRIVLIPAEGLRRPAP